MAMCSRCGNEFQLRGPPPPAGATLVCPRCAAIASTAGRMREVESSAGRGVNGLGITGFVCALVGIVTGIFLIPGLICSLIALRRPPRGLAIAGTVISVMGIALFGLLVAILLPSLARARVLANRAFILQDERTVVQNCVIYGQDHHGMLPDDLATLLANGQLQPINLVNPFAGESPLVVPASRAHDVAWIRDHLPGHCDLVYVGAHTTINNGAWNIVVYSKPSTKNLGRGMAIGFSDTGVRWVRPSEIAQVFAQANVDRKAQGDPLLSVPTPGNQ